MMKFKCVVYGKTECVLVTYDDVVVIAFVNDGTYAWGVPREGPGFCD